MIGVRARYLFCEEDVTDSMDPAIRLHFEALEGVRLTVGALATPQGEDAGVRCSTKEEFPVSSRLGRRDSLDPVRFNFCDGFLPIRSTSICRCLTFSSSSSKLLIHTGALSARKVKHFKTSDMAIRWRVYPYNSIFGSAWDLVKMYGCQRAWWWNARRGWSPCRRCNAPSREKDVELDTFGTFVYVQQ